MWGEGVSEGGESDGVTTQRSHSGRVRRKTKRKGRKEKKRKEKVLLEF